MADDLLPDNEKVFQRIAELMGGKHAIIKAMEDDFYAMKERWHQDVNLIGRILRAHLHVEYYMTEHLQHANPNLGDLDEARASFNQKWNLLDKNDRRIVWLLPGIKRLNVIRNRLAHNLAASVTEEDRDVFLGQQMYKAMRDASEKGQQPLSTEPIDVLEHFAEFASSMLHNRASKHGQAFAQAFREAADELRRGQSDAAG